MNTKPKTIDEHIAGSPALIRKTLEELRRVVREAAPGAEEAISYGMPTFKLNGNLVHFAAQKHHISFYPSPSGIEAFKKELSPYKTSKSAIQFPLGESVPYDLVRKIVEFRLREQLQQKK